MRPRGRWPVLVAIVALLAPTAAAADDLGGVSSATIAVDMPVDLPRVPDVLMADCFCTTPFASIDGYDSEYVGSDVWRTYGTWSITGARLRPPNNSIADRLALYPAGRTDAAIEATMFRVNRNVQLGLVARSNGEIRPGPAMRRLQVVVFDGRAVLSASVGTATVVLADVAASLLPAEYRLRMEVDGPRVRVAVGSTLLIDLTLPAPYDVELATGTFAGLVATSAGNERIDDVLVTSWPP